MRRAALEAMSPDELAAYAESVGVGLPDGTEAEKVGAVLEHANRTAAVCVAGMRFEIPASRLNDMELSKFVGKEAVDYDEIMSALGRVLGPEQTEMLISYATDEDGAVDATLVGFVFWRVVEQVEAKN